MQKKSLYNVAIVGATGAVGVEFLKVLEDRKFPVGNLTLLASARSVGKKMSFKGKDYPVEELTADSFKGVDIALFSAGGSRSKEFAQAAVKAGAVVIDNSSAFRMDPNVPLVVPEINPQDALKHKGIIANPNCTTIIMGVAIYPIHQINPIKRAVVATYQAVSGAGAQALEELRIQQEDLVAGRAPKAKVLKHVIANNVFSHNSDIKENGYNEEELKMVKETHKIFHDDNIQISPTCVRVPIYRAHSEAIHLELTNPADLEAIAKVLAKAPGVTIVDDRANNHFPMPLEVTGKDNVLVGRLRGDPFLKNGVNLFVCGDQLLKGAALNAVQIAELLI
jgi:aspartate-semialdehyde dehydrogenase